MCPKTVAKIELLRSRIEQIHAQLGERTELLHDRIEHLRQELWQKDSANVFDEDLEQELDQLLREYIQIIREQETVAC